MAIRTRTKKTFTKRRRYYGKRKMKTTNLVKRVTALEKRTKDISQKEYFKNDFFRDLRSQTGNVYTLCINEPAAMTIPFDNIAYGSLKTDKLYQHNMGFRVTFSAERTGLVRTTYISYWILRGKSSLNARLDVNNVLTPIYNTHWTGAGDGLATQGILPCPLINKEYFKIIAYRRFCMGNQVYVSQGPAQLIDTHREFYHKISMKVNITDPKDTATTNSESDIPTKDRFYFICITDCPTDVLPAQQPFIYINGQALIKTFFTSK